MALYKISVQDLDEELIDGLEDVETGKTILTFIASYFDAVLFTLIFIQNGFAVFAIENADHLITYDDRQKIVE